MKWTEFGGPGLMTAEEYVGKLEARLAELDASADIWEKRCMDSEARLAAAEARESAMNLAIHKADEEMKQLDARLAAAERVVEAARALTEEHRFAYANVEYGDPMIKLVIDVERATEAYSSDRCPTCSHPDRPRQV